MIDFIANGCLILALAAGTGLWLYASFGGKPAR